MSKKWAMLLVFILIANVSYSAFLHTELTKIQATGNVLDLKVRMEQDIARASQEYFEQERTKLKAEIGETKATMHKSAEEIVKIIVLFSEEYDKKNKIFGEWAIAEEEKIKKIVSVHDSNVSAYNQKISSLTQQIQALQAETDKHRTAILLLGNARFGIGR